MQINDILTQMGGMQSIAKELGLTEAQAQSGATALLPAILGGFKKQAQTQPTGLEGLGGLIGKLGGGSLFDEVLAPQPTNVNRGNDILGQIFGTKEVSRTVAANAATQSGLSTEVLKKMLPILAMLVTGFMAKQKMAGAPAGAGAATAPTGGGLGGLLGGLLGGKEGGTGLASMLDLDRKGNPLDDILQMAGKALR